MSLDQGRIPNEDLIRLAKKEEPRLISILLKDKNSLINCMAFGITPEYFWFEDNRFLFKIINNNYHKYGSMLTRSAMSSIMDMQSSYTDEQRAARTMYWDQTYSNGSSIEDYEMLKNSINARHVQQQTYSILHDNLEKVVRSTSGQIDISEAIKSEFMSLEGMSQDPYSLTMDMDEGMDHVLDYIIDRRENPSKNTGIKCGIKGLDDIFYGFEPGSYTIISGMPGGGKTTLMFNMGFNMAKAGSSVVYISIEKKAITLYSRLLSLHCLIDYNRLKRGGKDEDGIPDYIFELYKRGVADLKDDIKPKFECLQYTQGTKLSTMLAEVERIRKIKKIDVLIMDYLGVVGFETSHPTRPDLDLADVSMRFQNYAKTHDMVAITASQLKATATKEIRSKAKKVSDTNDLSSITVNTEDLAGSQKMVYDAENAISVVMNDDQPPTKTFIHITKARDNESYKTIQLDFDGKLGRISDPDLHPGQISAVDDLIFNDKVSIADLESSEDLWNGLEQKSDVSNLDITDPISADANTVLKSESESESNLDDILGIEIQEVSNDIENLDIGDIDIDIGDDDDDSSMLGF